MLAEVGQLDMNTPTQAGAQVRGAGQDVAQVLIPHEFMALLFEQGFDLGAERGLMFEKSNSWRPCLRSQ